MRGRQKLIVVSNRGPVTFASDEQGERVLRRGGGGLVSAMSAEDHEVAEEADGEAIAQTAADGSAYRLRLVAHDPQAYDLYYNVVANPVLWFVQHYFWGLADAPDVDAGIHNRWTQGYTAVHRRFAEVVVSELERQPGAAVFLHDYHHYLTPGFIRDSAPDETIAHFVHVPWPRSEERR